MPKISVIIPIYGVEEYIERCAISLFEQTLDDIEYLFINDCTKDNSINILKQVFDRYPHRKVQAKIIDMPQNSGQAAVRRYGIELATGEYVIHCDSDDWVETDMYKCMYDKALQSRADIVVCDYNISESPLKFRCIHSHIPTDKEKFINGILDGSVPGFLWNKLINASLLDKIQFYPKDNFTEDMVINIQLAYYAERIVNINKGFYHYFTNTESISLKKVDAYHILEKGKQCYNNFNIIYKFLSSRPDFASFEANIILRKYRIKLFLRNICRTKGGNKRWRKIFPELTPFSVFKYHLPIRTKIGYIFTHMGVYGCLKPLDKNRIDAIMQE